MSNKYANTAVLAYICDDKLKRIACAYYTLGIYWGCESVATHD